VCKLLQPLSPPSTPTPQISPSMKGSYAAPRRWNLSGKLRYRCREQLLHRNVQRFRGGLVFEAHRLKLRLGCDKATETIKYFDLVPTPSIFGAVSLLSRGQQPEFKAHRLVYHSTLGWRVIKKKKKQQPERILLRDSPLEPVCQAQVSVSFASVDY